VAGQTPASIKLASYTKRRSTFSAARLRQPTWRVRTCCSANGCAGTNAQQMRGAISRPRSSFFTSMGAIPFARRARSELRATGASPDAPEASNSPLTARESQIASMAAAGYANQEIADRLFITTTPSSTT
jgi:ATP/maltotriose-dependent transcriptional regulator MalT